MLGRFIPQWVLEQFPWANNVLEWFYWAKQIFHAYEGIILFIGLVIVWRGLRSENRKLGDRIDTLRQLVSAVRDQSEIASIQPAGNAPAEAATASLTLTGRDYFEAIRQLWRSARERMELAIENIPRSRIRSKYGQLQRYNYREVILALNRDGVLSDKEMVELLRMNGIFSGLRSRPTTATAQQLENFKEAYGIGTRRLPNLPEAADEVVIAAAPQQTTEFSSQVRAAAS